MAECASDALTITMLVLEGVVFWFQFFLFFVFWFPVLSFFYGEK